MTMRRRRSLAIYDDVLADESFIVAADGEKRPLAVELTHERHGKTIQTAVKILRVILTKLLQNSFQIVFFLWQEESRYVLRRRIYWICFMKYQLHPVHKNCNNNNEFRCTYYTTYANWKATVIWGPKIILMCQKYYLYRHYGYKMLLGNDCAYLKNCVIICLSVNPHFLKFLHIETYIKIDNLTYPYFTCI